MDRGVWEIGIEREQSRGSRPSLLVGLVVGGVVGFDGAFAVFSHPHVGKDTLLIQTAGRYPLHELHPASSAVTC